MQFILSEIQSVSALKNNNKKKQFVSSFDTTYTHTQFHKSEILFNIHVSYIFLRRPSAEIIIITFKYRDSYFID